MTSNDRKILILPFALENDELRRQGEYLGRQLPVLLRNCFEKARPGRVVTSPIATEKDGERVWMVHSELWSDEAAAKFAGERGFDAVVFGALSGPGVVGAERILKLRAILTHDRKVLVDKLITGDVFRITRRVLESMGLYLPMTPKDAVALFEPQTESPEAFEHYLAGLDELLALRSDGMDCADPVTALEPFETALAISPGFEDALTAELSCALQAADPSGAEIPTDVVGAALERRIAARPGDPRSYAVLAEIHIHRDDMSAALKALQRGLSAVDPVNTDLLRRSGDVLAELGRKDAAVEAYQSVLELQADDILVERVAALEIMLARNEDALGRLEDLLARHPDRVDLQSRCGLLLHRMDRKAEAWTRMAEMFRDTVAPSAADLVKLNTLLDREPAAERFVERLRAWYPPEDFGSRRRVLFARSLRLMGARFEAGLCLKSVVRLELDEEHRGLLSRERLNLLEADFDDRFALLAQRIVNEGGVEGADLLDFAIEEEPSFWPARFLKGLVLSRQGQYEDSIEQLELVLQLQPKNDVVWYTRGLQLVRLGRDAEAVRCFESAIELNSKEPDYHSNLALTQARLKNAAAARAALERVRALRPGHPENERLESSIDETL